jgi:hypothetical protein
VTVDVKVPHAIEPQITTVYTHFGLPVDRFRVWMSDYPLSGMCVTCGDPITLDGPEADWQHRA